MSKVDGSQVYKIINKVMSIMNSEILDHGRIVSYIFYKMLQTDGHYNRKDMAEYAMLGLLHDIGIMKTGYKASLAKMEETNLWGHSIYGYLFFKYLSPIDDKAEVILYHHLDYNKHKLIPSAYIKESEYLTLADKMDMFMRENDDFNMEKDYFVKNVNVTFSGDALQLFYKAQEKYDITKKLSTGEYIEELRKENKTVLDGEKTFKLYDTYGFPIDLTRDILEEQGLDLDEEGFLNEMQIQKETARSRRKDGSSWASEDSITFPKEISCEFVGYENTECKSKVTAIGIDGVITDVIGEGDEGVIVTEKTVCYAEMGGQVGDHGMIISDMGKAKILDTQKVSGVIAHIVKVIEGEFNVGDEVNVKIDTKRRMSISRNHSTTHLMHKALKEVLGSHVAQAGSLVNDERLRFDFSHFSAMTKEELEAVEDKVNDAILAALPIVVRELPIDEAKKLGAEAQFGEKYGDVVRVVSMGDYSVEFCGGCHLTNTAQAGLFKILSESGVAAGTRRIEAVTGYGVLEYIKTKDAIMEKAAEILKANVSELDIKASAVSAEMKEAKRELESIKAKVASGKADAVMAGKKTVKGVSIISSQTEGLSMADLRTMGDTIKSKLDCGVVVLAGEADGKITFLAMATPEAVKKGVHAGNIIREITKIAGGSGGGKPDMAQGGGKDSAKIDNALAAVDEIIASQVKE